MLQKQANIQVLSQYGLDATALLLQGESQLSELSVVRHLPSRRLVCRGKWGNNNVYVKLFFGKNYDRYAARDKSGVQLLLNAHLHTPNLLLDDMIAGSQVQVLVFAAIEDAISPTDYLAEADYSGRKRMAEKLAQTVAQLHQANLMQTDIHLNNFLIANDTIYTIDGDGIKQTYSQSQKQHNLATFLSKFDVLDDDFMQDSVEAYFAATNKKFSIEKFVDIYLLTQKIRRKTASDYADKKVFRQCSDVNIATKNTALGGLFYAASSHADMKVPKNIADLDALMQTQNLLKDGNTCTVALAEIDAKKIVIKRYNIKQVWHAIGRAFRATRAAKSWANAHRMNIVGIATAKPIALLEARTFGLRGKAYFLAEYIDAPDVAQYFAQTQDKAKRAEAIKNIVTLFYKLYLLQISHGDMKASNIKIVDNKPVLIDLDSMRQHNFGYFAEAAHIRDLKRFMQNWNAPNQPSDNALYNAFVKTFKVVYDDPGPLEKAGIFQNKEA